MEKGGDNRHNYALLGDYRAMSIVPEALLAFGRRLFDGILPHSCLLCAAEADDLVCRACRADLPGLPTTRCPHCGEPTTHGERCGRCLRTPPHFDSVQAAYRYDFPLDRLVHALKYGHQLALAPWFGSQLAKSLSSTEADCIVPLPLHPERLRERGFNQAAEIARALGRRRRLPVRSDLLFRARATAPQAGLALAERPANVRGAFECRSDLGGKRLLLVDDVMTSGATVDEAARTLKLHGAARVDVAVVARAVRD